MNLRNFFFSILIIFSSSILCFIFLEYFYRFIKNNSLHENFFGTLIFQKGKVFKNIGDIFTYHPNIDNRRVQVISFVDDESKTFIEYDYSVRTNNIGLIMNNDVYENETVTLFLGDSFTEGQGARPWFYELENEWNNSNKPMNGGIMGTGPMQWLKFSKYFNQKLNLNYDQIHVILIVTDLIRPVWNIKQQVNDCLIYTNCKYSANFQGLDLKNFNNKDIINHVNILTEKYPQQPRAFEFNRSIYDNLKYLLKSSYIISDIYKFLRDEMGYFFPITNKNLEALLSIQEYSNKPLKITLINNEKEIDRNETRIFQFNLASSLFKWSEKNNIEIQLCTFKENMYHQYDSHLNSSGYNLLKKCILSNY